MVTYFLESENHDLTRNDSLFMPDIYPAYPSSKPGNPFPPIGNPSEQTSNLSMPALHYTLLQS